MTNTTYTPGPWNYRKRDDHFVIRSESLQRLAITQYVGPAIEETNARVMAAAPQLLEALIEGLEFLTGDDPLDRL